MQDAVCGPAHGFDVHIRQRVFVRRRRIARVGRLNLAINHLVSAVLVVIVFIDLPHIVGRIPQDHENRGRLLAFDALRVFFGKQRKLPVFGQLKGIHETDARKSAILPGQGVIFLLDVHGRDVIGQQHDLVTVQFLVVFAAQVRAADAAQNADQKIARAHKRVQNMHVGVGQRAAELSPQQVFH